VLRYGGHLAARDLEHERGHVLGVEGVLQRRHLVHAAAERPHVRLGVVGLVGEELGTHVVGRADDCGGHVVGALEHSGNAQVAHLDDLVLGQEDVLRLQVSVQDVLLVHVLVLVSFIVIYF